MFERINSEKRAKRYLALVVATGVAGAVVFTMAAPGGATAAIAFEDARDGSVVDVGTMTVNLADEDRRYARIGLAIVLAESVDPIAVESKLPLVRDAVLTVMGAMTADDITGTDSLDLLRDALSNRVRLIFNGEDIVVLRVVLTDLLVQ